MKSLLSLYTSFHNFLFLFCVNVCVRQREIRKECGLSSWSSCPILLSLNGEISHAENRRKQWLEKPLKTFSSKKRIFDWFFFFFSNQNLNTFKSQYLSSFNSFWYIYICFDNMKKKKINDWYILVGFVF